MARTATPRPVTKTTAPIGARAAGAERPDRDGGEVPSGGWRRGAFALGDRPAVPRWVTVVSAFVCVLGVADSAWLTYAHYTSPKVLFCADTGLIDCAKVTTSVYSHPFGVPVALAGLLFWVGMLALCSPPAWRLLNPWFARLRVAGVVVGMLTVLWLVYVELYRLRAICLYCTGVHALTFLLFVTVVFGAALATPADA